MSLFGNKYYRSLFAVLVLSFTSTLSAMADEGSNDSDGSQANPCAAAPNFPMVNCRALSGSELFRVQQKISQISNCSGLQNRLQQAFNEGNIAIADYAYESGDGRGVLGYSTPSTGTIVLNSGTISNKGGSVASDQQLLETLRHEGGHLLFPDGFEDPRTGQGYTSEEAAQLHGSCFLGMAGGPAAIHSGPNDRACLGWCKPKSSF